MIITFLASFLIWLMFFGLPLIYFFDGKIRKEAVIHALFAVVISWLLSEAIKTLFPMDRPYITNGFPSFTITRPESGSFPSSHTAAAFALSITLWLHDRRIGAIYLFLASIVGAARIVGNVHYPIDIWAGAFLGSAVSLFIEKRHFLNIFKKKGL